MVNESWKIYQEVQNSLSGQQSNTSISLEGVTAESR